MPTINGRHIFHASFRTFFSEQWKRSQDYFIIIFGRATQNKQLLCSHEVGFSFIQFTFLLYESIYWYIIIIIDNKILLGCHHQFSLSSSSSESFSMINKSGHSTTNFEFAIRHSRTVRMPKKQNVRRKKIISLEGIKNIFDFHFHNTTEVRTWMNMEKSKNKNLKHATDVVHAQYVESAKRFDPKFLSSVMYHRKWEYPDDYDDVDMHLFFSVIRSLLNNRFKIKLHQTCVFACLDLFSITIYSLHV